MMKGIFSLATSVSRSCRLKATTTTTPIAASAAVSVSSRRSFASVGDQLPNVDLQLGFPPKKHNLADFAKNKSILVVGLPGAFTPTW
jgi:hypothetical protein